MATSSLSIAVVTGSASRLAGGLFNSVRQSALALRSAGHQITIISLADAHSPDDSAAWAPLIPLLGRRRGPAALGYAPAIGAALSNKAFDLVHQHGIWQAFSAQVLNWNRSHQGKVMISPRGMLDPWALRNAAWKKRIASALYERRNLGSAACLHALNQSEAASIRAFGLDNPIAIIPNGTELPDEGDGARPAPPAWWPGGKVLLFIGRLHPKKGVMELVDAFRRLSDTSPQTAAQWSLVIAGWDDGGHEVPLRAAIAQAGLSDRILLPGPIYGAEKDSALRHASAFILPSYSEGLPMSVLEAWAYGLPVLMTDACNLPEGFATGAAARIKTNPEALAASLATLLSPAAAESLADMGQCGRKLVEAEYGWAEIARRHADVYRWMIGRGSEPPDCVRLD